MAIGLLIAVRLSMASAGLVIGLLLVIAEVERALAAVLVTRPLLALALQPGADRRLEDVGRLLPHHTVTLVLSAPQEVRIATASSNLSHHADLPPAFTTSNRNAYCASDGLLALPLQLERMQPGAMPARPG